MPKLVVLLFFPVLIPGSGRTFEHSIRLPQDVDVLAVLDFQIPCFRSETPGFYSRCLLIKQEGY